MYDEDYDSYNGDPENDMMVYYVPAELKTPKIILDI